MSNYWKSESKDETIFDWIDQLQPDQASAIKNWITMQQEKRLIINIKT